MICSNCREEYNKSLDKYLCQDCMDKLWEKTKEDPSFPMTYQGRM